MMHEFKDVPTYVAEVAGAVRAVVDRASEFEAATDRLCEVVETTAPADFDGHHEPFLTTKLEDAQDACHRGLAGVSEAIGAIDPSRVRRADPAPAMPTARLRDDLAQALDGIKGTAYLLGTHAEGRDCDGEQHAVDLLSTTLYDCAERIEGALDAIDSLRSGSVVR